MKTTLQMPKHRKRHSVSLRLLFLVILCSSFFTLLASIYQLYFYYQDDVDSIHKNLAFLQKSYLLPISGSIYTLDYEQLDLLLQSVIQIQDLEYIEILEYRGGKEIKRIVGDPNTSKDIVQRFPLIFSGPGLNETYPVGMMTVNGSFDDIYRRTWKKAFVVIVTNAIKMFLASFCILMILKLVITRHLVSLAKFARQIKIQEQYTPFSLNRKTKSSHKSDEFDYVVSALNHMQERISLDIEKREKIEQALRESEERLKETAMTAKVGGWEIDLEGNTLSWTKETFRIHELEDNCLPDVSKAIQYYHPEDQQIVSVAVQLAIEKGEEFDFEARLITEKKNLKWVRAIGKLVLHHGKSVRLHGMVQDITERKLAEEILQESEEKFRTLSENSQDYIMRYDEQGRHLYQNQAAYRVAGYSEEEFIGKTHKELGFDKKLCDLWEKRITEVFNTGKPSGEIFSWESQEGSIYLDWRVFPEFDKNGNVITVLGVSRDITELKRAEEQIKASLKEKETLLQEIHHRVKNNMQVVSSLLKLQSRKVTDDRTKEVLINSQNRVLAMASVHESLYQSKNLSCIDIRPFITKIIESGFTSYRTESENVSYTLDVDEIGISIDQATPMGLVINELISNSLKYAYPDGRQGEVCIKISQIRDNIIKLIFADDGIGIPTSLDWKNSESMGLKLIVNLVENQLEGSIEMETDNGTHFNIMFKKG